MVKPLKPVKHSVPKVNLNNTKKVDRFRIDPKKTAQDTGDIELTSLSVSANGTYYAPDGKAYKTVVVDIGEYKAPGLSLSITPATTLYDITVDTLKDLVIIANATKNTNNISRIEIFVNGVSVKTVTDMPSGGIVNYTQSYDPATNTDQTIKAIVTDSAGKSVTVTKEIKFVGKTYYGTVGPDVTSVTEAIVTGLSNSLKGSKDFVFSGITMDYGKVLYAYPASFGEISSIKDTKNNIDYSESFAKSNVNVGDIVYNAYLLTDPVAAEDVQITFA